MKKYGMTKYDIALGIGLVIFSVALSIIMNISGANSDNKYVSIQVNGEEIREIRLPVDDYEYKVDNKYGKNTIHIDGDSCHMHESDCRDQLCVLKGNISEVGGMIVCAPNRLVVEIKAYKSNQNDIDVVNY
ncbi:MAG: NusG domain II-containing protein [Finegoldia sp.]|nr:NusG domain II-containing protein [Finegoldia sp.]